MFSQANISPTLGAELLQAMGLDALDIQRPEVYAKYLEVAKYFGRFSDAPMVARAVGRRTPKADKLDKIYEYMNLRKSLEEVRKLRSEIAPNDMIKSETPETLAQLEEIDTKEQSLLSEIRRYEQ